MSEVFNKFCILAKKVKSGECPHCGETRKVFKQRVYDNDHIVRCAVCGTTYVSKP